MKLLCVNKRWGTGLAWLALAPAAWGAASLQSPSTLGTPLSLSAKEIELRALPPNHPANLAPASGFTVDIRDRINVLVFYHEVYLASEGYQDRVAWTGDIGSCQPGDVAAEFREDTRRRINYFRAMAGLPADITFESTKNGKAQEAALIYAANQTLSHYPIRDLPGGSCLTTGGDEAGQNSNIAIGTYGPGSVDEYIRDDGGNNAAVGHRRWMFYPRAVEMGSGSVPPGAHGLAANTIWVIGNFGTRPARPEWVSWPPPGYVPYMLVYPRWSFSLPLADFNGAIVTMTCDGNPVPVSLEPIRNGYGDNTLVWIPQGLDPSAPDPDRVYTVTLNNVVVGGLSTNITYQVTAMDPYNLMQTISVSGPMQPYIGVNNTYAFNGIPEVMQYEFRSARAGATTWKEGAENSPAPQVVDGSSGGYAIISTALARTGSRSFHLALADFDDNDQTIVVDRYLIPSATSEFEYYSRFRFAGVTSELSSEISTNDGIQWITLDSRAGSGSNSSSGWDSSWVKRALSLAAYAGRIVRVRLRYHYEPYTEVFLGTGDNYGVFIDDVRVTNAEELTDITSSLIAGGSSTLDFNPPQAGTYYLQMQPEVAGQWFGFGPALVVQASQSAPPSLTIRRITLPDAVTVQIEFTVQNPTSVSFHLESATDPDGPYAEDASATFQTVQTGIRYRALAARNGGMRYYRVGMD